MDLDLNLVGQQISKSILEFMSNSQLIISSFPLIHSGKSQDKRSKTLKWESRHGRAFTDGILYHDGGLQVNETGLYFVYSRVEFRSKDCKPRDSLAHIVYIKRGERFLTLMANHQEGFCQAGSKETWTAGSNLGSMHQLNQNDWVFVNVSQPTQLSFDDQSNYFGLFKLP